MTRADRIRSMSDEELCQFFMEWNAYYSIPCDYIDKDGNDRYGPNGKYCGPVGVAKCHDCTMEWLTEDEDI